MKQAHGHGRENEKSLVCFGCDFSGSYSFAKIINIVAIRCHILKLKCTKFHSAGGAYSAPPDPPVGFKVAYTSKGRRGEEGKVEGTEGKG